MTKWDRPPGLSFPNTVERADERRLDRAGDRLLAGLGDRLLDSQGDRPGGLSYK
jgi:hypothetical protein